MFIYNFNPCCSGQWSRTARYRSYLHKRQMVLILIVMEDGLVQMLLKVLLIILERLNPYCNGRWSCTSQDWL